MSKQLTVDIQDLQSNLSNLRSENITFQHTISELQTATVDLESAIQMKDASMKRKDSELESKNKAIEEKDATITAMSEQITKTREYLATKQQVSPLHHLWPIYFNCMYIVVF